MTQALRDVFEQIEKLPEAEQDRIAEILQEELEEQEWDAITSKPGFDRFLGQLVRDALEEDRAGRTQEVIELEGVGL